MQQRWKKVLASVLGVMVALLGVCFGAGALLVRHLDSQVQGEWSTEPLSVTMARDVFGIEHLPPEVLRTQRREGGFQDQMFDALLQIPPGTEDAFLQANGLQRDANGLPSSSVDQFEVRIRGLTQPTGAMRVTALTGVREAHLSDGGGVAEYRNASLLQFDDQLWVALEAFDT